MKAGTHNHLKTKRLKRLLGIPLYQAVGILEGLWLLCTDCCDEGNIGKFSDEEIADYLEWQGSPSDLVNALAESGWLDADPDARYIVHDWLEHCPEFIRERVRKRSARSSKARKITTYVDSGADKAGQSRTEAGQAAASPEMSGNVPSIPIPFNSIPSNSSQSSSSSAVAAVEQDPRPKKFRYEQADYEVAKWMHERILDDLPNAKAPNLEDWANEIRLMRERDGPDRSLEQIRSLFDWANRDQFWKSNILSPSKLREKWDQLQIRRKSNGRTTQTNRVGSGQRYQGPE